METATLVEDTLYDATELQTVVPQKEQVTREVTITRTQLMFSRIFINVHQKPDTRTLEVKQQLITNAVYSGIKVSSSLNDSIYESEEFKKATEPRKYNSTETRVAWILVPAHETDAQVMARYEKYRETGMIFKILSNAPVLDENQIDAINRGLKTYDELADGQAVRYGANDPKNAGKLILDKKANVQYKRTGFSRTERSDVDLRYGKSEIYQTPKIQAELQGAGTLLGQSV